jgi:hypothetical protein
LEALVRKLAEKIGLRRSPRVVLVSAPISPLLWALGPQACLWLPSVLWEQLTADQQRALLVHELAHLRRRDHWVRRLELLVLGLFWWHPVAWWARRELREAEEQCCDAWVVWALPNCATAYATALVHTVTFLSQARFPLPATASGVGHAHSLKRRLSMILRGTPPRALSGAGLWAVLGLGIILLPLAPTRADQPTVEAKPKPSTAKENGQRKRSHFTADVGVAIKEPRPEMVSWPTGTTAARPESGKPSPAEQLEEARDQVELLQAGLEAKKAEYMEALARLKHAQAALGHLDKLANKGVVTAEDLAQARAEVEIREARVLGKKAEYRAAEIRLKQGRRRLSKLQHKPKEAAAPKPDQRPGGLICRPAVADFGVVHQGKTTTRNFWLINNSPGPIEIGVVRTSSGCLTATCERHLLDRGATTKLTCRIDPRRFTGMKSMTIYVPYTAGKAGRGEIDIALRADSREATTAVEEPAAKRAAGRRLQELEKRMDAILKEMESLRRELGPKDDPRGRKTRGPR